MARVCMRRRLDLKKLLREMVPMVPAKAARSIEGMYQQGRRHVTYVGTLNHVFLFLCHLLMSYRSNV